MLIENPIEVVEKKRVGRPTKYKPQFVEEVFNLALLGLKDKEIAQYFEVDQNTFNDWKIEHPEFYESLNDGKVKADGKIARAMYEKAAGAEWEEEQAFKVKTGKDTEIVSVINVKRKAPPDTKAAAMWLANRQRRYWKESGSASALESALSLADIILRVHEDAKKEIDVTPGTGESAE